MSEIFLKIINMSISASYIVLAVLLLRLLLKKAPKWITVVLWGIVAVRLVCPFSIESVLSLIPSSEVVSPNIMTDKTPTINTGIPIINSTLNPVISNSFTPNPGDSANPLQIWIPILTAIWIVGMVALLIYTVISYARVRRKIGTAVLYKDNIYQSENVVSPFVLGIIKPKIYLPFNMNEKDMEHVVAHEMAHIRRKDHLWKPLGFLLLTLHWFNPLMWLGYVLLCRDIELACDEKVIKELDHDARADYSQALLTCSVNRRTIAACPLAFGEVGVKDRVKSVLNYKKPAFWIIIAAVVACVVVAVCFLTNPPQKDDDSMSPHGEIYTDYEGVYITIKSIDKDEGGQNIFNIVWHNETDKEVTIGEMFSIEYKVGEEWSEADFDEEQVFLTLGYLLKAHKTEAKTYIPEHYDLSKSGEYRFIVPFSVKEGDKYVSYKAWAEFTVGSIPTTDSLREKYPEFFGLNAEDGLTVYIWQLAETHYSCYLVSTAIDRLSDHSFAFTRGASISEMRSILNTYNIEREKVLLRPIVNPISSYAYTIDEAYCKNLENVFWSAIVPMEFNTIFDTATFDIDDDGIDEVCTMSVGTTSGLFTFTFNARELGTEKVEYHTVIYSQCYDLSFQKGSDGITRVQGITQGENPETHLFDISIKDGYVYLTENGVYIGEIN